MSASPARRCTYSICWGPSKSGMMPRACNTARVVCPVYTLPHTWSAMERTARSSPSPVVRCGLGPITAAPPATRYLELRNQVVDRVAQQVLHQVHLLVAFGVHEIVVIAIVVQVPHFLNTETYEQMHLMKDLL